MTNKQFNNNFKAKVIHLKIRLRNNKKIKRILYQIKVIWNKSIFLILVRIVTIKQINHLYNLISKKLYLILLNHWLSKTEQAKNRMSNLVKNN